MSWCLTSGKCVVLAVQARQMVGRETLSRASGSSSMVALGMEGACASSELCADVAATPSAGMSLVDS